MKLKLQFVFLCFALIMFKVNFCLAQDTTESVFHKPTQSAFKTSQLQSECNFAFYVNPGYILRGGSTLGFQYHIKAGVAVWAEYGKSVEDWVGKYSLEDDEFDANQNTFSTIKNKKMLNIFELGIKYYPNNIMEGGYIALAYGNISGNQIRYMDPTYTNYLYSGFSGPSTFNVDYSSNEYKFLIGSTTEEFQHFFLDYNLGLGFRSIYNPRIVVSETYNSVFGSTYSARVKENTDYKFWFFIGLKLGYKF
jgi:hypothetical protein